MTTLIQNYAFHEFWGPYTPSAGVWGEQRCTFDGLNRQIIVNPLETNIDVRRDIYSAWKEWVQVRDNAKFLPAVRVIGGDPVGGGLLAGDIYFLMNGWRVVVDHEVSVTGTLYNDQEGQSPFLILPGGGVTSTVSNLSYAVNQASPSEIADAVHSKAVDSGLDLTGAMRLILSALVGKVSGAEGTTITFRSVADDKNRIVATVDANGNRTAILFDAT